MKKIIKKINKINNNPIRRKIFSSYFEKLSEGKKISLLKISIKYNFFYLFKKIAENINIDKKRIELIFSTSFKYKNKSIIDKIFLQEIENEKLERDYLYKTLANTVIKECIKKDNAEMFEYALKENHYTKNNIRILYNYLNYSYEYNYLKVFKKVISHYIKLRKGNVAVIFTDVNYFLKSIDDNKIDILKILIEEINFMDNKKEIKTACILDFDINSSVEREMWDMLFNHKRTKKVFNILIENDEIFFRSNDLYNFYKSRKIRSNLNDF